MIFMEYKICCLVNLPNTDVSICSIPSSAKSPSVMGSTSQSVFWICRGFPKAMAICPSRTYMDQNCRTENLPIDMSKSVAKVYGRCSTIRIDQYNDAFHTPVQDLSLHRASNTRLFALTDF